jgi:hypothetical protein
VISYQERPLPDSGVCIGRGGGQTYQLERWQIIHIISHKAHLRQIEVMLLGE